MAKIEAIWSLFFLSFFIFGSCFEFESEFQDFVQYYLNDGFAIEEPEDSYSSAKNKLNLGGLMDMFGKSRADNKTCHKCASALTLARALFQSPETVLQLLGGICKDTDSLSRKACLGGLDHNAGPVSWLFQHSPLKNEEICSVLAGHGCVKYLDVANNKSVFWELPLPAKREFKPLASTLTRPQKILHLTDIHLDLLYEPGSNASCNEPLCCRASSEDHKNKSYFAGYWSEVRGYCDTPQHFVIDSLKHIASAHPDLDAIFWTGDNVPHDGWMTSEQANLRHIHTVTEIVSTAFNNVPVFPVLGNHEPHPVNFYVPDAVAHLSNGTHSMKWLYETLTTDYWARWIDSPEAKRTFQKGGYYSRMFQPNWKVIVLNSNMARRKNFWILFDPVDPDGQLAWLIKELDQAESVGAYVTILGHVPPKNEMYDAWLHNYIRIVDRYSHVISGSFYGHTHDDEVVVLYNEQRKPISVNFISGSITTFRNLNPMYAIFQLDTRGFPLDSTVYMTDMAEDNLRHHKNETAQPNWKLEYHPRKSYNLTDMSPASWDHFLTEAQEDIDLGYLYSNHYHRHSSEYLALNPVNITKMQNLLQHAKRFSPFLELNGADDDSDGGNDD